ncbi:MAG: hypothetical protein ACRC5Q_05505 [Culicoidibacterales bacterium]
MQEKYMTHGHLYQEMKYTDEEVKTNISYVRERLEAYGTTIASSQEISEELPNLQAYFPHLVVRKSYDERATYYIVSI